MIEYGRSTQEHKIHRRNSVYQPIGGGQNLWGLILAGGEGRRLKHFINNLFGVDRPKQYCSIVGKRSMLQHTLDRAKLLIPPHRVLTVANYHHLEYIRDQLRSQPESSILFQPCSRDTGNGILLPLLHIHRHDPTAIVAIFPSDQFILDEMRFMQYVARAFSFASNNPASIVLLGISPTHIEPGYGWIEKGEAIASIRGTTIYRIAQFREKPDNTTAEILFKRQALWNTFVMVGPVSTFLKQYQSVLPNLYKQLGQISSPDTRCYRKNLNAIYSSLPAINFSKTILETCAPYYKVMEITDTYWNDWGDASRVMNDINRHHLTLSNRKLI
jgi:mannose-1-phosphate guanylyltransferase